MKKATLLYLFCFIAFASFAQLNEKVGIGVRLQLDSSRGYKIPVIAGLIPDGAAEKAGLKAGDIILKVDDKATRNMVIADVVAMITGDEGSSVKMSTERKGVAANYTIMRGKYKYSAAFYESAVKGNEFCTAITKLMNDAGYNFKNTMDTGSKDADGNHPGKVKVPGAASTSMNISVSTDCQVIVGYYSNKDEVNVAGTKIIEQVRACFPEYYYEPEVDKQGNVSVNIGRVFKDGFEAPILQLFTYLDKTSQKHKLMLRINGGKTNRYHSIASTAGTTGFANTLRTIYNDISNDFKNVKGKRHEVDGGIFSSSYWYEVTPVPEGAKSCGVAEGGMSLGAKNTNCGFYKGSSRTDAVNTYNTVFDKMAAALGSDFVYSSEKSQWDMNLSKNVEAVVTFGSKKKKNYESYIPLIVLVLEKYEDNSYAVRMLFYRSGL